jgi:ATP-dependent RNA helicase DHX8/PRP22
MVSTENVFYNPRGKRDDAAAVRKKFISREGDHLTLLAVLRAFSALPRREQGQWAADNFINPRALRKAQEIAAQLEAQLSALGLPLLSCGDDSEPLRRALTAGLFPHAARRQPDGSYRVIATGQPVALHPSSALLQRRPDCVVFNELVRTTKQYARDVCAIEARWLPELAPAFFAARAGAGVAAGT